MGSTSSSSSTSGEAGAAALEDMSEDDEEAMIDAQLAKLDERLKEISSKLGGRKMR